MSVQSASATRIPLYVLPPQFRSQRSLTALSLVAVVALALPHLQAPFTGDQALYLIGAREMLAGSTLYADFWDIKQPGTYAFYALSSLLFGADEFGVHCGELIWLLLMGLVASQLAVRHLRHPRLAAAAPLLVAGPYYLSADPWYLTQIEILPALPFALCLALFLPAPAQEQRAWRALAAGACGCAGALFVWPQAPMVFALAAVCASYRLRPWLSLALFTTGFVLFGLAILFVFHRQDALAGLYENLVVYPSTAPAVTATGPRRLVPGLKWFLTEFGPWCGLAALAIPHLRQPRQHRLTLACSVWIGVTLVLLAAETRSIWSFHFLLCLAPVGLLALIGLDASMSWPERVGRSPRWRSSCAAALLLAALTLSGVRWWPQASGALRFASRNDGSSWIDYRSEIDPGYRQARLDTAFLATPGARPGPIYVFGSPVMMLLAQRRQALRWSGWGWEAYTEREWGALASELRQQRPVYVFMDDYNRPLVAANSPETLDALAALYEAQAPGPHGTWYRLRSP